MSMTSISPYVIIYIKCHTTKSPAFDIVRYSFEPVTRPTTYRGLVGSSNQAIHVSMSLCYRSHYRWAVACVSLSPRSAGVCTEHLLTSRSRRTGPLRSSCSRGRRRRHRGRCTGPYAGYSTRPGLEAAPGAGSELWCTAETHTQASNM